MNIFFLHPNITKCARWHCDKHVVKMILEYTQILYTAFYLLNCEDQLEDAPYNQNTNMHGYKPVRNKKHPSVLWAAASKAHYKWLAKMALKLVKEYQYRYGEKKEHACKKHLKWLRKHPPADFPETTWLSDPTPAMPDEYKVGKNVVASYRNYYRGQKADRGLLVYTRRHKPHIF